MKFINTLLIFGLMAIGARAQATTCANLGDTCSDWGVTACECNEGYQLICDTTIAPIIDGEGGETEVLWFVNQNCPTPADGGLACVNGLCTS